MNIDLQKQVIEIAINKTLLSMIYQPYGTKMQPETMVPQNTSNKLINIEAQIRILKKDKKSTFLDKTKKLADQKSIEIFYANRIFNWKKDGDSH